VTIARLARCRYCARDMRAAYALVAWPLESTAGVHEKPSFVKIGRVITATGAGYTDRADAIMTANTFLHADLRSDDDTTALGEARSNLLS
jgi:hypothetical protein